MDSIAFGMLTRGDNMRGRGLRWEDHKFKAQHEIRISICTERMGVGQIISSPQHSKDDEMQNPLHR